MRAQVTKKKKNGKRKAKTASQSIPKMLPAAQSKTIRKLGRPQLRPLGKAGDVLVIHKEFVSDLVASATAAAFSVVGIPINPGNVALFPWLSQIASNFESYVFRGLKFLFETDAPSTTPGSMLMAVDYEVTDPLPVDKQELMSRRDSTRSAVWAGNTLNCTKEDLHKRKTYYVQSEGQASSYYSLLGNGSNGEDVRLQDVGELLLASSNSTASAVLGEMYVEYEVELLTPDSSSFLANFFAMEVVADATFSTGISITYPFGNKRMDQIPENSLNPLVISTGPVRYGTSGTDSVFAVSEAGTYFVSFGLDNWSTTATNPIVPIISTNSNGSFQSTHDVPNPGGAVIADFQTSFYWIIADAPPDVFGDVCHLNIHLTGVGINVSSSCLSYIRIISVPDFNSMSKGGIVPAPGSFSIRGKKKRGFPGISCLTLDSLAGNASPLQKGEKEASSTKVETSMTVFKVDMAVEEGIPSKMASSLKSSRRGRFRTG